VYGPTKSGLRALNAGVCHNAKLSSEPDPCRGASAANDATRKASILHAFGRPLSPRAGTKKEIISNYCDELALSVWL
jgi:hypothetical protein